MEKSFTSIAVKPDYEGFLNCVRRKGTPQRTYFAELFIDGEVQEVIGQRYGVLEGLREDDPQFGFRRHIAIQRFLGYDYVIGGLDGMAMPTKRVVTEDTAGLKRAGGRSYIDEHTGPITSRAEFESYPWPKVEALGTQTLEWYEKNLPDDMCVVCHTGSFAEYLSWLMGYETLCIKLFEERDLVADLARRLLEVYRAALRRILQFKRVKIIWGSDDMGFKTGTLIGPNDLREFVLPNHQVLAGMAHEAGRPYFLHSCGKLEMIMEDLIEKVRIDAKHSFEDVIEDVIETKRQYGKRLTLLGGIDVDFLCQADAKAVRRRVRKVLKACLPGGGFCLGSGNTVANYIPVDNYLAMLDEGRKFTA